MISVIIPVKNEAHLLGEMLQCLSNQSIARNQYEIIVVDNGSIDASINIAEKYADVVLESKTQNNPYVARNIGMRQAQSEFIALIDAKCIPDHRFLENIHLAYEQGDCKLVAGNIEFTFSSPPTLGEVIDGIVFIPARETVAAREGVPGGALYFHRQLIEDIGFFREDMRSGADTEWTHRAWNSGCVHFAEDAVVQYAARSFTQLLKKGKRTGHGLHKFARLQNGYQPLKWYANAIARMRPASFAYINHGLDNRLKLKDQPFSLIRLSLGIWIYRIAHSLGRLGF